MKHLSHRLLLTFTILGLILSGSFPSSAFAFHTASASNQANDTHLPLSRYDQLVQTPPPNVYLPLIANESGSGGEVVLGPDTVVLTDADNNAIQAISADGSVITIGTITTDLANIKVGNVIIGGISKAAPNGFLRRVVSIQPQSGGLVLTTEQASLGDAFRSADIEYSANLIPASAYGLANTPGVRLVGTPQAHDELYLEFKNVVLYDADGDRSTTNDQIVTNGLLQLSSSFYFRLKIENSKVTELYFTQTETAHSELAVTSGININLSRVEVPLLPPIPFGPFIVPGTPLILTPQIQLTAGIEGGVSGGFTWSNIIVSTSMTAGVHYENGQANGIGNYSTNYSAKPPFISTGLNDQVFVGVKLSLLTYGIFGAYVKANLAGKLDVTLIPNSHVTIMGGLEAPVGIVATVFGLKDLIDIQLISINYWWIIYSSPAILTQATRITAGLGHTCAVTENGGAACWGINDNGQLGDGTTTNHSTPGDVSGLTSGITAITAGWSHTCALTSSGGVKCWGQNNTGMLGDGTTIERLTPVNVSGLGSGVIALALGFDFTCSLSGGGGVKCWGGGRQLGDGTDTNRPTPGDVSGLTSGVTAISAGEFHACALTVSGGVKCWGNNSFGQLGDGTISERLTPVDVSGLTSGVTAIIAGGRHTCALTVSGGVKCWGDNEFGQLGDGTTIPRLTPVDVSGLTSGVTAITAGWFHTCAQTTSGAVMCWGNNGSGQLGDATTTDRSLPVNVFGLTSGITAITAGGGHTCALIVSGGVKCWGNNTAGQLGDGTIINRLTPVGVVGFGGG